MREDQTQELEDLTEKLTDDLIKIAYAATDCGFDTPEERGDKVWLYKGLNQCASAITKVEQVLAYRRGDIPNISATEETQRKHEENLIKKAEAEAEKIRQRMS